MEKDTTWEWTDSAVEMIPFGLLAGFYGEKEIRITKLAEEGFCFRTVSEIPRLQEKLRLCFYDLNQNRYQEIPVKQNHLFDLRFVLCRILIFQKAKFSWGNV